MVVERTRVAPPVMEPPQPVRKPALWAICLSKEALIDEVIDFLGRDDGGRLVGSGSEGKFLIRDDDGAFGHVRFVDG